MRRIAPADDEPTRLALEADRQRLAQLHEQMAPLQVEINQVILLSAVPETPR